MTVSLVNFTDYHSGNQSKALTGWGVRQITPEFGLGNANTIAPPPELCYISTTNFVLDKTSNNSSASLLVSLATSGTAPTLFS